MTVPAAPSVFIGSSSEGLEISRYLQIELEACVPCQATLWTQGVFGASQYSLEALTDAARRSDFAVLVATPDDTVTVREATALAPRDNVIFELGLFTGVLGRERTFIVAADPGGDRHLRLPTDLAGITWLPVKPRPDGNLRAAVAVSVVGLAERISAAGPRSRPSSDGSPRGTTERALSREVEHICSDALAQGWRVRTRSDTTLRLESPRGHRHTFTFGALEASRLRLRRFAGELRGDGLRVSQSVRRPVEDSPE